MPASTARELDESTKATWLDLIDTCKQVKDRTRLWLASDFVVRFGGRTEVISAGTEVIFFCLFTGAKATTQRFRTEGTFYLEDGRTLSILGCYGRTPKGKEAEYAHKEVEVKDPSEGPNSFDATPLPLLASAAF